MNNQVKNKKKIEKPLNFSMGKAINLIPPLTVAEKEVEVVKSTININAAFALLFLIILSIVIVGFNLVSKLDLNNKRNALYALEQDVASRRDVLSANDEILRRVSLYRDIEESTVSSKTVIQYWTDTSNGFAHIINVSLTNGMIFSVSGTSDSLGSVSELWYLLGNDPKVENIDLKSVSKNDNVVRFNFEGQLNLAQFANSNGE